MNLDNLNKYEDLEEISIREEMFDFIRGNDFGTDKSIPYVHRHMRRTNHQLDRCACWREIQNKGVVGCPYCDGIGSYWDESLVLGIMYLPNKRKLSKLLGAELPGVTTNYDMIFLSEQSDVIDQHDRIYVPHKTNSGALEYPISIKEKYLAVGAVEKRLDNSNLEYRLVMLARVD